MSTSATPLTPDERARYQRHLILPQIGEAGQQKLKAARVLVVGAGGLGSPALLYLAAAGVGRIGIVDDDIVDESNLQRQVVHGTRDVGRAKVSSASARLRDLNPHVDVRTYHARLTSANASRIIGDYDVVLDGADNFPTRYLINDACVLLGKPCVHASVIRFEGQASVFATSDGPCYRCLFPAPPAPGTIPDCAEGGVFGVLPGLLGIIQATEAIKIITQIGTTLAGRLLLVDALGMHFRTIELARDPACRACGTREIDSLTAEGEYCETPISPMTDTSATFDDEITPAQLSAHMQDGRNITLLDVREPYEWAIARLPDARLIPLNSLPTALNSLDRESEVVVYCHHGSRSAAAVEWLRGRGFSRVYNLTGGIDRWSLEVDAAVRRY